MLGDFGSSAGGNGLLRFGLPFSALHFGCVFKYQIYIRNSDTTIYLV